MSTILRVALSSTLLAGIGLLAGCNSPESSNASSMALLGSNSSAPLPGLPASLPLQGGPATAQVAAPPVARLPAAARPTLREISDPEAAYAYLDRAASYDEAIGDAPPDYAFGYDGVTPWGWQADDGSIEYAEPIDDGYRYYYYEPGADTPYLVRDPYYSYAFDAGALVVIYDRAGRIVPRGGYGPRWDYAGRFLARAEALRGAAHANHQPVVAANWAARRAQISASNAAWSASRPQNAAWAAYHASAAGQERAHWQGERDARAQATQQFGDFQRRGFQRPAGAAPAAAVGNAPQVPAARAPAASAMREATHLAATQQPRAAAPHENPGQHGPQPAFGRPPEVHASRPGGAAQHAVVQEQARAAHAERGAARAVPHPAERAVAVHREGGAPRGQTSFEPREAPQRPAAEPHVNRGEGARGGPSMAPRAPEMHAEAPHMQAPHAEVPRAAPAPHPAAAAPHAAPHGGPPPGGGGGHEHH